MAGNVVNSRCEFTETLHPMTVCKLNVGLVFTNDDMGAVRSVLERNKVRVSFKATVCVFQLFFPVLVVPMRNCCQVSFHSIADLLS
jgi:hypothetical protein